MIDQRARWRSRHGPAPRAAGPVTCGRLPALADAFIPRPETGYGLDAAGSPAARADQAEPEQFAATVLAGPSGYGKTSLAAALATGLTRSGATDVQVWITASSRAAVLAGYARAAAAVGLAGWATAEEAARQFIEWLGRSGARWLVVLDDVRDLADIRGVLPAAAAGQLLVTCPQAVDLAGLAELLGAEPRVYRIGQFSPREALSFLTARLSDDKDQRVQAVDLAEDLGYMPLALALATATMAGTSLSCREYRLRFSDRREELAGRVSPGTVSAAEVAWSLALDRADQRAPAGLARPVLAMIALLDPAGVPLQVPASQTGCDYVAARGSIPVIDPGQVLAAIGNLAQAGLVTVDQDGAPGLVVVHPVVQAAVRRLVPAAVLEEAARSAADALMEVWPALEADEARAQALRDCAARLGAVAGSLLWSPEPHPVLTQAGTSLTGAGLAGPAVTYWDTLLRTSAHVLGAAHPHTLAIREQLVGACLAAGQYKDAVDLITVVVAERERALGADHPETLTARASLARAYRLAGLPEVAVELYEQTVASCQWVLGADHPETLATRSELARSFRDAGQIDRAIATYERNLGEWERAAGPGDPQALAECIRLAQAYQAAGRFDDAIAALHRVRAIQEQGLGREHPDTLATWALLAYAYRSAGRLKEALPFYRQALSGRQAVLGASHPDTLTTMANLASCCAEARQTREAITLFERVLAARERAQGPDHPDTITARGMLAGAYHSAGRLAEALPAYEQTVADFDRVLGPDHLDTLTSRGNLAYAYHVARRHADAVAMYARALADCERVLGADHQLTRTMRANLAQASR